MGRECRSSIIVWQEVYSVLVRPLPHAFRIARLYDSVGVSTTYWCKLSSSSHCFALSTSLQQYSMLLAGRAELNNVKV